MLPGGGGVTLGRPIPLSSLFLWQPEMKMSSSKGMKFKYSNRLGMRASFRFNSTR
jgi:hypothetical protein